MKRSVLLISAALIIPAAISLVGIGLGVRQVKPVVETDELQKDSLDQLFKRLIGPLKLVQEGKVPVGKELKISAFVAQLAVTFDGALRGQALLRVESETPDMAKVSLAPDLMSFAPNEDGEPIQVTLVLPTTFDSLEIQMNGSRCEFTARVPVEIHSLKIAVRGSKCEFEFQKLAGESFSLALESGKVDLRMDLVEEQSFDVKVAAGKLTWEIQQLQFAGTGSRFWKLQNATGKSEVHISQAPAHALLARVKLGKLELVRGDSRESIAGLNQERSFSGPPGAPEMGIDVEMGKVDFRIDKVAASP